MGAKYGSSVAWHCESGGIEGHYSTSIASLFYESAVQMLGVQRNTKFHGFCCCTNILIGNNKMLNKNLATSPLLCLRYCFKQCKHLCYRFIIFNHCMIQTYICDIITLST